jgi:hypothetical protein
MSTLVTETSSVRCLSLAAQCAAAYPKYGERGCGLARAAFGGQGEWLEIAAIAPEKKPMGGWEFSGLWRSAIAGNRAGGVIAVLAVVAGLFSLPNSAAAQAQSLVGPQSVTAPQPGGGIGSLGATIVAPSQAPPAPAPSVAQAAPGIAAGNVALAVTARYGQNAPPINAGLIWRVYSAKPDSPGNYRLIKEDRAAAPTFALPPGNYVVHASLGLASAAKAIQLRSDPVREVFDIPAGAIRLEGRVGDVRIPLGQIAFEIFTGSQFDTSERRPIAQAVQTGDVVLLPEGTYYIVSNYGDGNSVVRSDVHIDAGKLTDIVVTHRAAIKTLKLVNNPGGEALANTQWTVLTPGGDVIKESIGAFPRLVLSEGDYHVIARNEGRTYQRDFKVITGVDGDVEVLAR